MTRFWLVRHAPTHAKTMVGWTDLAADLSDQAALARLSAHLPADAPVISSDLTRAIATADALGPRPRLPHDPGLREIHFGLWEARSFTDIAAEHPHLARAFWETPGHIKPPGGESWDDLTHRTMEALTRLQGRARDLIVVAHFGPILAALQYAQRTTPAQAFSHRIEPLSVTCLTFGPPPQVFQINHRP